MKKTLTTDFSRIVTVETEYGAVFLSFVDTQTGNTMCTRLDLKETAVLQEFLSDALEPQKFYLKLFDGKDGFVNRSTNGTGKVYTTADSIHAFPWKTQFTQEEIDSDPELKKFEAFKVPVASGEATD